jgi:ribosome-associated protein
MLLEGLELAHKIVDIVSDKQAVDTVLLDVRGICGFADYFVICNGESDRQVKAIVDAVSQYLKKEHIQPNHEEGTPESGWILLDFGDVIVHVFSSTERDYYQLDQFWEKAATKLRIP